MDERLRAAPIGAITVGGDDTVTAVNDVARDLLPHEAPVGQPIQEAFPRSVEDSLPAAFDPPPEATEFEEYYPALDRWLSVSVVPGEGSTTVYVDDVTDRRRHEQTVERLRAERERVAVVDDLIADVLREFVDASSREEIVETVCTRLGESDRYRFAWVGTPEAAGGLAVDRVAGETGDTFPAIRDTVDDDRTLPERRAVERSDPQVVQSLGEAESVPDAVRVAAFADGVQSVLALPLVYGSSVYGVVGVYAGSEATFSDHERTSFEALGELAGLAINATRNRRLLLADAVTEVAFELGVESPLVRLSDNRDTTLELEGTVPAGDGRLRCFVGVTGASPSTVVDAAESTDAVGDARIVRDDGAGGSVELALEGDAPLVEAVSRGATVRGATVEEGRGRLTLELPADGDVREMAGALGAGGTATVLSKRERNRSPTTAREFRAALDDRLTERQATVLRTAYLADYFESPRGSTAEEVADSLGITGSTLLYHLRAAQRKLLDAFYDDPE
jgi:predicted DNA binding protein